MGWLDYLSPAITAASQVAGGYEQGQQRSADKQKAEALLAIKQKRQDEQDAIMNALHQAQTRTANATANQGPGVTYQQDADGNIVALPTHLPSTNSPAPVTAPGPVAAKVPDSPSPVLSPGPSAGTGGPVIAPSDTTATPAVTTPKPPPTIGTPTGIKGPKKPPVPGSEEWKAEEIAKAKIGDKTLVPVQQADGTVVYTPRSQAAGMMVPGKGKGAAGGNLPAPMAAKVGQFGEMLKKASDLMPATDALNVSLSNSAAQDVAAHGIGIAGGHIPGTQGVGSLMVNRSPEYSTYQAALSPFVLAAAHALSGARINDTQVQQIRASIEIKPGDPPKTRAQKHKNLIDLINSIGGSLPADAIGAQEDQMDPQAMVLMKGYGYKPALRASATATPKGASSGDVHLGKPALTQAQYDAGIARGLSKAEIAKHYDLSQVKQ